MKKILGIILMSILIISLTGCINENNNNSSFTSKGDKTDDLGLYSDDTKYVFQNDNTTHVFYYEGDEIIAYHTYVDYETNELAKYAYNALEPDNVKDALKFYIKDKYLVFEWNYTEYEGLTVSNLHKTYRYMQELKKEK